MRWFWAILVASVLASPAMTRPSDVQAKAIFARYDPQGRLPNTKVKWVGNVRVGGQTYSVYNLDFANPLSKHGMQRIAFIKNNSFFAGSFMSGGGLVSRIQGRRVIVPTAYPEYGAKTTSFLIGVNGPPRRALVDGDLADLEMSI